jgi:hypothetical protein
MLLALEIRKALQILIEDLLYHILRVLHVLKAHVAELEQHITILVNL